MGWEKGAAFVARALITAVVAVAVFVFVAFMTVGVLAPVIRTMGERYWRAIEILDGVFSLGCAVAAGRAVWKGSAAYKGHGFLDSVLIGALTLGAFGFVVGFFGPMIHADPKAASVGPLLGLFFTGPVGAVIGAVCGGAYWFFRRKSAP